MKKILCAGFLYVLTSYLSILPVETYSTSDASSLEDFVLNNYHRMVRPSETTHASLEFGMYHISSLDNVEQTLSLVGFLLMTWVDARLKWTPSSYGNISTTYLRTDQIWVPPLVLANSAEDIKILSDDSDTKSTPLAVFFTGTVYWLSAANFLAACTVDITYYPFDKQTCDIQVSSWMYDTMAVNLTTLSNIVNLELYEENGEWDIMETETFEGSRTMHGHPMSQVTFRLRLERKNSYYILNMILPVVFISYLGCLVFSLPVESGEKNGFSLTILLSLTVVLTIVSDKIPTTSINLCILSVFLLCTVIISVLEILITVIIQRVHIKKERGHRLSNRLQATTRLLASIFCFGLHDDDSPREDNKIKEITKSLKSTTKVAPITGRTSISQNSVRREPLEYTDLANVLDKTFFVVFFSLTTIITLVFHIILVVGQ